jgi:hypothetical protein
VPAVPRQLSGSRLAAQFSSGPAFTGVVIQSQEDRTSAEKLPEGNTPALLVAERKVQRDLGSRLLVYADLSEYFFFGWSCVRRRGQENLPGKEEIQSIKDDTLFHGLLPDIPRTGFFVRPFPVYRDPSEIQSRQGVPLFKVCPDRKILYIYSTGNWFGS